MTDEAGLLREAARLRRNVRFVGEDLPRFADGEEWVAVPAADFDALRAALAVAQEERLDVERGTCWFCKGTFVIDALIAGYDTFDEQRLACLACNERMSGDWRPA